MNNFVNLEVDSRHVDLNDLLVQLKSHFCLDYILDFSHKNLLYKDKKLSEYFVRLKKTIRSSTLT